MWYPSVDGHFIARNPYVSIRNGLFAKVSLQIYFVFLAEGIFWQVPLVTGACDDEGTYVNRNNLYTLTIYIW